MAQSITTMQTVFLNTTLSGGVQPYDPCTTWAGSYTASNGVTGAVLINNTIIGTPYITSSGPCSGTALRGSLSGTFYPNGFTGDVGLWVYGKDASGITDESNHLTYTVITEGAFFVNAGNDISGVSTSYTLAGLMGGGTSPYTHTWTNTSKPSSSPAVIFTPNTSSLTASVSNLLNNGDYIFSLYGADAGPHSATDTMKITVSGQAPPIIPIRYDFTTMGSGSTFTIKRNGTTVFTSHASATGTYGSTPGSLLDGDTIDVRVFKAKINYYTQAVTIDYRDTPPGVTPPPYYHIEDVGTGPATLDYSFVYYAGHYWEFEVTAESSLT